MIYAILSDVHSNLEALLAVLEDLDKKSVQKIYFLGDAVGYGANPNECWDIIKKFSDIRVAGNHDIMTAKESPEPTALGSKPVSSMEWTRNILSTQSKKELVGLALEHSENGIHFVHGSPFGPAYWHYILDGKDAEKGFASSKSPIIFVGHSHVPLIFKETAYRKFFGGATRQVEVVSQETIILENHHRYIINMGSVGQPRDGNPKAAYGVLNQETATYQLHRVPYDIEKAAGKIKQAGLPGEMGDRLKYGR